jgi:hypothetical protein
MIVPAHLQPLKAPVVTLLHDDVRTNRDVGRDCRETSREPGFSRQVHSHVRRRRCTCTDRFSKWLHRLQPTAVIAIVSCHALPQQDLVVRRRGCNAALDGPASPQDADSDGDGMRARWFHHMPGRARHGNGLNSP